MFHADSSQLKEKSPKLYTIKMEKASKQIKTLTPDGEIASGSVIDLAEHKRIEESLKVKTDRMENMIQILAYYDLLTRLPNRTLFQDRPKQTISISKSENTSFAILIIDLVHFKEINNTLGNRTGDLILRLTGLRISNILGDRDMVSRLGADEFAVLLKNKDADEATKIALTIFKELEEPFSIEGLPIHISASIGIAIFPGHGEDANTLIRRAHIAMHVAEKIESGFCVYSSSHGQYSEERFKFMGELRQAIEQDQLFLVYQPKIDLKTGRTIDVEALVRWNHPDRGIIQPNQFIELAQKTGLIKQLTLWILKGVLRQLRSWDQAGLEISVAVNLSVRSLQSQELINQIEGLLSTWGVVANRLRLEIIESIIMSDPDRAMKVISDLTSLGIHFSIDDFGTGYSSLSYLQKFPADEIKIDKSFVINMMDDNSSSKIVQSIIDLGHNLGLKVVAEGVENKETMERLISLGCDAAQGFFISRPIPQAELIEWLNKEASITSRYPASKASVKGEATIICGGPCGAVAPPMPPRSPLAKPVAR